MHKTVEPGRDTGPTELITDQEKRKRIFGWKYMLKSVVPGVAFLFIPKCPLCLAAYISLVSGAGISSTTAGFLRYFMIVLCVGSFIYFVYMAFFRSRWMWKKWIGLK